MIQFPPIKLPDYDFRVDINIPKPKYESGSIEENEQEIKHFKESLNNAGGQNYAFQYAWHSIRKHPVIFCTEACYQSILASEGFQDSSLRAKLGQLSIAYRETIAAETTIHVRFVRQTSSADHVAIFTAQCLPQPTLNEIHFDSVVHEDTLIEPEALPEYVQGVYEGLKESALQGGQFGYMGGLKITLVDLKDHSMDSSKMSFKTAGWLTLPKIAQENKIIFYEPLMSLKLSVPVKFRIEIFHDLNERNCQIGDEKVEDGMLNLTGTVKLSRMIGYHAKLHDLSQGQGVFLLTRLRYDPVPEVELPSSI